MRRNKKKVSRRDVTITEGSRGAEKVVVIHFGDIYIITKLGQKRNKNKN